ncbi:MAG: BrnT family toxin [Candidatus Paceibacterota bacterium]
MKEIDFGQIGGFDWDSGNLDKNWEKHQVMFWESEEIFFNEPLLVQFDKDHSSLSEIRYYALGKTNFSRLLFVVFMIRDNKIRVISARPMSQKEKNIYQNL